MSVPALDVARLQRGRQADADAQAVLDTDHHDRGAGGGGQEHAQLEASQRSHRDFDCTAGEFIYARRPWKWSLNLDDLRNTD